MSDLAEELHKPIRRKNKKRRVLFNGIDRIWAADLVNMKAFSKFNRLEIKDIKPKFSVEDKVRISTKKKTFEKGYTARWTEEIFTTTQVKHTSSVTYKIADHNGEEIRGTFYEPELQKTSQELYRIDKVIKRGKTKSLVKWKAYSDDFNSWVDNKDIVKIS